MTMTRTEKSDHQFELAIAATNSGYTPAEWSAPLPRRARIAAEGHAMMTAAEYREHRMGRRSAAGMAATDKLTRMGYRQLDRGSFVKRTRR